MGAYALERDVRAAPGMEGQEKGPTVAHAQIEPADRVGDVVGNKISGLCQIFVDRRRAQDGTCTRRFARKTAHAVRPFLEGGARRLVALVDQHHHAPTLPLRAGCDKQRDPDRRQQQDRQNR